MQLPTQFLSLQNPPLLSHRHRHYSLSTRPFKLKLIGSLANSPESRSSELATALQSETLKTLEWPSLCNYLSPFTSTSMALSLTKSAAFPIGQSQEESQKLLDQTTAALHAMEALKSEPLDLSAIEDVSGILRSAGSGQLLTVRELCRVRRTLGAARAVSEKLAAVAEGGSLKRYTPLLEILQNCNFQKELEKKIGFCIDCNLSTVLDRASEELELIRAERKRNMGNLDSLLKEVSVNVFQAGGIDRPLITKRRSRMCVGVRASHKYLLPDGVVLNVSSSGATYFMEPKEAVELNNMEVKLSNSEKAEEMAILSLLTSEIAESEAEIKYLLDKLLEVDLAFAKAAYAQWMNGVCPIFSSTESEVLISNGADNAWSVDIEGIQHPLLLGSSLRNFTDFIASSSGDPSITEEKSGAMAAVKSSKGVSSFPVPIDIKVQCGTRVVVISGPNTGGKTASMKTLGLASLMSKAGMYLPAKKQPRLPWFDLVLADIGDSQSLERSLSTFSGHISRICEILEIASKESLVLIDEIGSGTDPLEGVALSTSILQYLKTRVNLAVVTTHYADLSRLKGKDSQYENAALEFSLETLQPTYQILWGSIGNSNALTIANSIGFDKKIIERAKKWVDSLKPEKQQERKVVLYQSLMEERSRLEAQFRRAESLHADIMGLYHEVRGEADNLEEREIALRAKETEKVQQELNAAKSQIDTVVLEFENLLQTANSDEFNLLIRKSESAINSIVKAHRPGDSFSFTETDTSSYQPQSGEQVHVKGLGNKLATVVEASEDDNTLLVQYGKIRVRVEKSNVRPISNGKKMARRSMKKRGEQSRELASNLDATNSAAIAYGPLIQTSKNTVDLLGMRVEEAAHHLDMAISARGSNSVLFIVHGMGTGVVKEQALEILRNHPRVAKYEQENPMNYGCTVAYIK
ncbi:DNA mismatch repair protein MutS isoform 1 [Theobroma cacao]|uniref:DNA mismatch repair protein MutS isoform 1 n=1 Tax=Theobroma cacao TaxID=3641 RepID=A0A061GEI4_THECC|nr:DNA mismatch repair protein MutS isoform 1 [Theobroma cacao]